jgi:hypothetical protein
MSEQPPAPSRRISRRELLRKLTLGTGGLLAASILKNTPPVRSAISEVGKVVASQGAEPPKPRSGAETGRVENPRAEAARRVEIRMLEGKERDFKLKQFKAFIGEFVTSQALDSFTKNGFLLEDRLQFEEKRLPNGSILTDIFVETGRGRMEFGAFSVEPEGIVKDAAIYVERGQMSMDQLTEGVRDWLKIKDVEFQPFTQEAPPSGRPKKPNAMMGLLTHEGIPGGPPVPNPGAGVLVADIPFKPILYKHPEDNIYYAITTNAVAVKPSGQVIFHREYAAIDHRPTGQVV